MQQIVVNEIDGKMKLDIMRRNVYKGRDGESERLIGLYGQSGYNF
jgi:hypothetical protein